MNEIQKLKQFPRTEAGIQAFVERVNGQIQARQSLDLLADLTALEKIIKAVKDNLKDQLLNDAGYEGPRSFVVDGVRMELASRKTYTYKHCATWQAINEQQKRIEEMMKAIDKEMVDPETGEVIPPAQWSQTDYIKVTLPKS